MRPLALLVLLSITGCYSPWRPDPAGEKICVAELCDGYDNDCDGAIDEDFDLTADPEHCGRCGEVCPAEVPQGAMVCAEGACVVERCVAGFEDVDGERDNGCEAACTPSSMSELCNGRDDDCDGFTDEDIESPDPDESGACARSSRSCAGPTARLRGIARRAERWLRRPGR